MSAKYLKNFYAVYYILLSTYLLDAKVAKRSQVDKIIENEITYKLADDLVQSIEKKFNVDLERSLDMVMTKIHLLLQNGTQNTLDRFTELQTSLDDMKVKAPAKVDSCLQQKDNQSTSLTEKALHQMVVCGYALIGQDPVLAINKIHTLKNMIRDEVKPINAQKKGIYELLRVCGHEHDSLKKVVKCVISKSPALKSVVMSITGKLIDGIVDLTKMLAHGAMHEACLIEVLKTAEDEAAEILAEVKTCVHSDDSLRLNGDNSLIENLNKGDINTLKDKDENDGNDVDLKNKSNVIEDSKNNLNSTDLLHKNTD
ncbi:uncharacterized protein LOC121740458 isoform X2 [Aricia agestis]|uniref:uncharacterized protein LOC121740458 isoform X2 n=1 Tax=Aricia agestis TaxID=91739 RepID=UPI001C209C61|nr:uncharacterized protein LOC121740458 isoform X2 [Aricia agestis]